jgi:hypothetical protein
LEGLKLKSQHSARGEIEGACFLFDDKSGLGKRVYEYIRLATLIGEAAAKQGCFQFVDRGCVGGEGWSGRRGMICSFGAWISFNARLWSKFGLSPVWIEFDGGKNCDVRIRGLFPILQDRFNCLDDDEHMEPMIVIPIRLSEDEDQQSVIGKAVYDIDQLATFLGTKE